MRRFLLLFLAFSLTELHANGNNDLCLFDSIKIPFPSESIRIAQSDSNQALHDEINAQSPSDVISTLTLVVNSLNNALTSTNNQVTVWSLVLSLITIIIAAVGIIGIVRLRKFDRKFENVKKHLDYQQKKDELKDLYMERINNWMLEMNLQLADNLTSDSNPNNATSEAFKKTYLGYYLIKLSVTNIPIEKKLSEEKKQAIDDIQRAINQIVERGEGDDLKELQEMAEREINKEKKKMLKKAAKELQDRLLKK